MAGLRSRRAPFGSCIAGLAIVLALAAAGCGNGGSAPSVGDPNAEGKALVERFFTLLVEEDASGLDELLAPSFQVVRANGTVQDKSSYLAELPDVSSFTIDELSATSDPGLLVVSYQVTVAEVIDGAEQPTGPAPRLSVFQWQDGAWRLAAHANFGAIDL